MKNKITLYEYLENQAIIDNITNVELAKRLDISYPTFANIKKRKPSRKTYHKIAEYLNIDVETLVFNFPITKD